MATMTIDEIKAIHTKHKESKWQSEMDVGISIALREFIELCEKLAKLSRVQKDACTEYAQLAY